MSSLYTSLEDYITKTPAEDIDVFCQLGWAGRADSSSIILGIAERFKSNHDAEKIVGGVVFHRTSLHEVSLVARCARGLEHTIIRAQPGANEAYTPHFDQHEVDDICQWMREHVYH